MRKPAAASVRLSSVPRCLRHVSPGIALEEAGAIATFLQGVTTAMHHEEGVMPSADYGWGLSLCFDLLRDKIAIASGELPFPTCGLPHEEDLPPLWTPPEAGGAHE